MPYHPCHHPLIPLPHAITHAIVPPPHAITHASHHPTTPCHHPMHSHQHQEEPTTLQPSVPHPITASPHATTPAGTRSTAAAWASVEAAVTSGALTDTKRNSSSSNPSSSPAPAAAGAGGGSAANSRASTPSLPANRLPSRKHHSERKIPGAATTNPTTKNSTSSHSIDGARSRSWAGVGPYRKDVIRYITLDASAGKLAASKSAKYLSSRRSAVALWHKAQKFAGPVGTAAATAAMPADTVAFAVSAFAGRPITPSYAAAGAGAGGAGAAGGAESAGVAVPYVRREEQERMTTFCVLAIVLKLRDEFIDGASGLDDVVDVSVMGGRERGGDDLVDSFNAAAGSWDEKKLCKRASFNAAAGSWDVKKLCKRAVDLHRQYLVLKLAAHELGRTL
ncbi:unnamed protein product [Closterium sp. Naga37s-1]|nr:unnamed protein product [Closterium sp. Naga37s-1]